MSYKTKIKDKNGLKEAVKTEQTQNKKVVQCHGCFDIIHPGHIRYLEQAKKFGDVLVVSLTADKFILKGDDRPYMPEELRVNTMAALEIVDYVYLDDESWAGPILEFVQPNIYVKGKEYENVQTGGFSEEKEIVERYGGKVYFSSGDVVFSSSSIIEDYKKKFSLDHEVYKIFCQRNKITRKGLLDLIHQFSTKNIAVFGEVLIDEYIYTEVIGLSGEAPILTVRPIKTDKYVGAAGIIAKHLKKMGGNSTIYSIVGKDTEATYIKNDFDSNDITHYLIEDGNRTTIKKARYLGDNQKLFKVDFSESIILTSEQENFILNTFKNNPIIPDCIIFSDFAYGFISNRIREEVIKWANERNIPVIADVSSTMGGNILKYKNVFLITPTEKEARMAFDDKTSGLSNIANRLLKQTNNKNIIITLGANGVLAFKNKRFKVHGKSDEHLEQEYIPAIEKKAVDPVGAGDAMLSMLASCIACGATLAEGVYLGNIASYLEVNKNGNIPISKSEIQEQLSLRGELD